MEDFEQEFVGWETVVVVNTFNPSTQEGEEGGSIEFQANHDYIVRSCVINK